MRRRFPRFIPSLVLLSALATLATAAAGPGPDCCTAQGMKEYAAQASFLDIVGIKLGMSPKEAFAAVHSFNPQMKIDIATGLFQIPGATGALPRIPRYAVARTVGVRRYPSYPVPFQLPDGSSDVIVMEFTTPPNPPLVARISRRVVFPSGKPILASTLLAALRKKYGQDNFSHGDRMWIYDANGKLLNRQLTEKERVCSEAYQIADTYAFRNSTGIPSPDDVTEGPQVSWDGNAKARSYIPSTGNSVEINAVCIPFTIAMTGHTNLTTPSAQNFSLTISIESPALLYASYRSTQDWLQTKADAIKRREESAIKQRSAPKL